MAKIIVDALGEQCPIPVVKATKALGEMKEPGLLEVHVDNEIAVQNVMRLAMGKGLAAKSEKLNDKHFVITMEVSVLPEAKAAAAQNEEPEPVCVLDIRNNTVVAIDTAAMGRGDDELGKTLMKGFIYALSQLEQLPRTIIFYNGGAHIPVEGSVSLEDLKSMEAQGVEILTCGTCLNYYGLTDKLAVGQVANMYTIVEKLSAADKVIKP
ncbi:MAG: sulfurtransferase-like selenium metabolism protein YedF [Christensenellales bacterium]|jgi:selenium metabolism protein YedF